MSQLKVSEIHKSYRHRHVVKGVSFGVESGSVVGLLGPNGAGKTTSFYMVVGLVTPEQGSILLDDEDITSLPIHKRARLGISYLPQEASVFRKLTVVENIQVALDAQKISGSQRAEVIDRLINEFSLNHIRDSYGYALSGGERRRVEIARSLVGQPKFLLLDEPFAGIDPIAVYDIQQIIRKLRDQGIGVLITDHNVRETLGICDYSYIMKDGAVQVQGAPEAITQSELARKFYLGENFRL